MIYDLNGYANLYDVINDKKYALSKYLKVKKEGNLYLIKYNKSKLTLNNVSTLGLFRSVICDESGNILSMAPPKSNDFDYFSQTVDYSNCILQEFVEGTMINVFWDLNQKDWNIATRSNIGANCKFNMDAKETFRYMFLEAMNYIGLEFSSLDKKVCYSFVLQHPKNRIVVPILDPDLYLVRRFICSGSTVQDITNVCESEDDLNQTHAYKTPNIIEDMGTNWNNLIEHFNSDNLDYTVQGVVIVNKNMNGRSKLRSKNYEKIKHLKGNSPKMQFHYYHLRQNGLVKEFLTYYPEYKQLFRDLRSNLHDWTIQLLKNYHRCFIRKEKALGNFPYNFKTHMYKLHELYINELRFDKKFINKAEVIYYVNGLHPAQLMHAVNYNIQKYTRDIAKVEKLIAI